LLKFYPKGGFEDSTFCHFFINFSKNRASIAGSSVEPAVTRQAAAQLPLEKKKDLPWEVLLMN
jgi:hypothetical protein